MLVLILHSTVRGKFRRASYSRIYIHLIWATWDRLDLIDDKLEPNLYNYIVKKYRQQNGFLLQIDGTPNHIHLLVKLLPKLFIRIVSLSGREDMRLFPYLLSTNQRFLHTLLLKKNTIKLIPAIRTGNFLNKPEIDINRKT